MQETLRTLQEWESIFNVKIMDFDGFDRTDPHLFSKLFTREQFAEGLVRCTCSFSAKTNWSGIVSNDNPELQDTLIKNWRDRENDFLKGRG